MLSCALVLRRTFDPAATMELVDRYQATGLSVVPVMLDRIMELPDEVLRRFSGRSLRFVTAAGSRMRPDVVIDFMNHFGDVIYNNYNATEVGAIALAGPADLRAAPDTAGRPMPGTEIRILDEQHRPLPAGEIGAIFARTTTAFEAYTSGQTKEILDGFMATGDIGYPRCRGAAVRGGSRRRDDRVRWRERVPDRGGEGPDDPSRRGRRHRARCRRREVRPAAGRLRGAQAGRLGHRRRTQAHVRGELANYKVPRDIVVLDDLPRNAVGKILRRSSRRGWPTPERAG